MNLTQRHLGQLPRMLARPSTLSRLPQTQVWGLRSPVSPTTYFYSSPPACQTGASKGSALGALTPNLPVKEGIRFQYEPASTRLSFRTWHQRRQQRAPNTTKPEVDVMVEGQPLRGQLSRCEQEI
eukprot:1159337-Pelagomonas_calceolata.AAC.1